MIDENLLKREERAVFLLRALYRKYGYLPFKMSKFEEYDLYVRNKDFLVSDRIITFSDTNGKLMALKPDVTLSIIKNGEDRPGVKQKLYYNENVYRVSGSTHQYKEIMQTGLECIGDLDLYDVFEVLSLAAQSLASVAADFVLDISHLGLLTALLDEVSGDETLRRKLSHFIAEKNSHDMVEECRAAGIPEKHIDELCTFAGIYGNLGTVIGRLAPLCESKAACQALEELNALSGMLRDTPFADHIFFDFSIVNDMNYYNGIVFKGFLNGICEGVLSGGQYDKLMVKMGRTGRAVGFGLYLDLLEDLQRESRDYDVDVLLLYDERTPARRVADTVARLTGTGNSVSAQKTQPAMLRFREIIDICGEDNP